MSHSRKEIEELLISTSFAAETPSIMQTLRCGFWMLYDEAYPNRSKLGGLPELPNDTEWPRINGRPMEFLLQVYLSECSEFFSGRVELPSRGVLFFFYDFEELPLGDESIDDPGWRVLFIEDEMSCQAERETHERTQVFPERRIDFFAFWSLPWSLLLSLCDTDENIDDLDSIREAFDSFGQVFLGNPNPYQYHPGLLCRRATTGESWTEETGRAATIALQDEWIQLAQLFSNPEQMGWSWYAEGALHFMIHRDDLAARRFDRVRCCGQCS